jgi:phosphatidylglycerophosphate synthase
LITNRSHFAELDAARVPLEPTPLSRVVILADESANWRVAGLRQLDRLVLCLEEFAKAEQRNLSICVLWSPAILANERWLPAPDRLACVELSDGAGDEKASLVLSTRLFLYRNSIGQLHAMLPNDALSSANWNECFDCFAQQIKSCAGAENPWQFLDSPRDIRKCERRFLAHSGKSQDGVVSRYLNRPISRAVSHWLLKLPIHPTGWSLSIFALPLIACLFFLRGHALGFITGCAIFQLYSILDGCDGEIARAKFLESEFGRRLDSLCDLIGNVLLALCLGIGLGHRLFASGWNGWPYVTEGIVAAVLILLSEGIVFARRSRSETEPAPTKWNGALYRRHHEFFERSGILLLGDTFAWWVVQLTKRDMAMLGFLVLAIVGWPEMILHLQLAVAGISSAMAGNAFLRPAPAVLSEEAS